MEMGARKQEKKKKGGMGGGDKNKTNTNKPSAFVYLHCFLQVRAESRVRPCWVKQVVCVFKSFGSGVFCWDRPML